MMLFGIVIGLLISCAQCRPRVTNDKYTISTEYVNVERLPEDGNRHKRSSTILLPDTMKLRFKIEAGEVTFNLEKAEHFPNPSPSPVYTIEESGIKLRNHKTKKNFALYQDLGLGASVLVKYPSDKISNLEVIGAFNYKGSHYQITPPSDQLRRRRDTAESSTHKVQKQAAPDGDFNGDEMIPPPRGSLSLPRNEPPFTSKILRNDTKPALLALQERVPSGGGVNIYPSTIKYSEDSDYMFPPEMDMPPPPSNRRKRDSESVYVEYLVVCDYGNTDNWKARVGGDTDEERLNNAFDAMYEYYLFVINGIDVRFRTATASGPKIRVVMAALIVSTSASTSPWITQNKLTSTTVDDAEVLLDFAIWRYSSKYLLPRHDHAALFTGFDLATRSSTSTLGMAYLNSVCTDWAVSENEETYNALVIHIAGHELGHNIGSRHDGSGNSCRSSSLYLMAARLPVIYDSTIARNPWTFSSCSKSSIQSFVAGLGESSCLRNVPQTQRIDAIAGLVYSADDQCKMTYGNDAVLCRENLYYQWDSICYAMQCKRKDQSSCVGRIFPFEGTPCGNKRWCQGGQCVYSENAPSKHDTCVFGDDPHSACYKTTSCDDSDYFSKYVTCCETCLTPQTTTELTSTANATSIMSSVVTDEQSSLITQSSSSPSQTPTGLGISTYPSSTFKQTSTNTAFPESTSQMTSSNGKSVYSSQSTHDQTPSTTESQTTFTKHTSLSSVSPTTENPSKASSQTITHISKSSTVTYVQTTISNATTGSEHTSPFTVTQTSAQSHITANTSSLPISTTSVSVSGKRTTQVKTTHEKHMTSGQTTELATSTQTNYTTPKQSTVPNHTATEQTSETNSLPISTTATSASATQSTPKYHTTTKLTSNTNSLPVSTTIEQSKPEYYTTTEHRYTSKTRSQRLSTSSSSASKTQTTSEYRTNYVPTTSPKISTFGSVTTQTTTTRDQPTTKQTSLTHRTTVYQTSNGEQTKLRQTTVSSNPTQTMTTQKTQRPSGGGTKTDDESTTGQKYTEPISTTETAQTSTSTKSTTTRQTLELSYELQTMISLFITAAVVI